MQIDVFDLMAFFGFFISICLAIVAIFEYKIKSEQHRPSLKLSWEGMPPLPSSDLSKALFCIENIGTKDAKAIEVKVKYSYQDEPLILREGGTIAPGLKAQFLFKWIEPSESGEHEVEGIIVIKHGKIRNRKRTYKIGYVFYHKE